MRLLDIAARAHPAGNRIDLDWTNPDPAAFPGVRVVRRAGTHPRTPTDGVIVASAAGLLSATDSGLRGETVYYYTLFPFQGDPPVFAGDLHNRVAAMATSPYDFAGQMYALLPALYHRYDEAGGPGSDAAPATSGRADGQLRRFLDLPGGQFDQIYSLTRAALGLCHLERVPGSLLPLLAQWLAWKTDHRLDVEAQRNEIRFAPAIYQAIGLITTVEATVKRISNWESRTKEFVHNVARTNQAERLNLWSMLRPPPGDDGEPGEFGAPTLASLNFVYEGRASAVGESDGSFSFFYHTYRHHGWDIWVKRFAGGQWQPSEPVVDRAGIDKHPAAVRQDTRLWLFWENCDRPSSPSQRQWRIHFRTRTAGIWSASAVLFDTATERRSPAAAVDDTGGVWLFWLERTATGWAVKYNRHDGEQWLPEAVDFPLDLGQDPRVDGDLFVLFHPSSVNQRLWLFWARHEPGGPPGQSRWTIAYRVKPGLDPAAADWSAVRLLPKTLADSHDREPFPVVATDGNIEIFWSSTRNGGWSLWRNILDIALFAFGTPQQLSSSPFSHRAPLAVDTGSGTLLAFRSNASLEYGSAVYGATRSVDGRYAGTTTVDTRNAAKLALRGKFADFQTYSYDTGANGVRTNDERVARDTIGLFLTPPGIVTPEETSAVVSSLANALAEFMPITERAVFIVP
jgi:hypothetical protein